MRVMRMRRRLPGGNREEKKRAQNDGGAGFQNREHGYLYYEHRQAERWQRHSRK
jgi:hypothetical protein